MKMNHSSKAFLLTALVFPGCGHFYLKKYATGSLFLGISALCFYFILVTTIALAQQVSDKILKGEIPVDFVIISEEILTLLADNGMHDINTTTICLFSCWILAMIDSFRLGRREDARFNAEK